MTGIIADLVNGGALVTTEDGDAFASPPQSGLFLARDIPFSVIGGLSYLQAPTVAGSCGGRVTPQQINSIVSELLCFARQIDPNGHYDPTVGCNLANAFDNWASAVGSPGVEVFDAFGVSIGHIYA